MSDLIKSNGGPSGALQLTQREAAICNALTIFNQLRNFKLDVAEVLSWKDTIVRVCPDVEVDQLKTAIDGMIAGRIPYDPALGIQNIIHGLKFTIKEGNQWKILKPIY